MAEGGIVERLLEAEEGGEESENAAGSLDPVAAAVAIDAARFDPELSAQAGRYLDEHRRLISIQAEHLHEQREVQLSHLKLRRWGERMRVGVQFFLALIGALIVLGILGMLVDAVRSRSVVVEAFQTPPALAGRGLNGHVVATQVLDELQKLRAATRTAKKGLESKGAWSSDIKVEVPETGVSIGEIDRLLHDRFGHDVHIDGDLIQTPAGALALTIRGDGVPARTFNGEADDLEKLTSQAAEYAYGQSQPGLYAHWLAMSGRAKDVISFVPGALAKTPEADRPSLVNDWALAFAELDMLPAAAEKLRLEMRISPPHSEAWWRSLSNLAVTNALLSAPQGDEPAWREYTNLLQAAASAPSGESPDLRMLSAPATFVWDLPLALKTLESDAKRNAGAGSNTMLAGPWIAETRSLMHDPTAAAQAMVGSDADDPNTMAEADLLQARAALDANDPASAVVPMEHLYKAWLSSRFLPKSLPQAPCYLGLAYGLAGRMADAEAVFQRMGPRSLCQAFHGDVLAHAGDAAGASRLWADGIKLAPDLAPIYLERGLYELAHGDLPAAQADFETAHAKAPHFADPLKAWGDLLVRQGKRTQALEKYDEALRYAPAWESLRQARAAAAQGR